MTIVYPTILNSLEVNSHFDLFDITQNRSLYTVKPNNNKLSRNLVKSVSPTQHAEHYQLRFNNNKTLTLSGNNFVILYGNYDSPEITINELFLKNTNDGRDTQKYNTNVVKITYDNINIITFDSFSPTHVTRSRVELIELTKNVIPEGDPLFDFITIDFYTGTLHNNKHNNFVLVPISNKDYLIAQL